MDFSDKTYVTNKSEISTYQKPKCAKKGSYRVELVQGNTYFWCTCGYSQNQPFCDGSHSTHLPGYKPLKFTFNEPTQIKGLCGCKQNKDSSGPYCDGSHKNVQCDW